MSGKRIPERLARDLADVGLDPDQPALRYDAQTSVDNGRLALRVAALEAENAQLRGALDWTETRIRFLLDENRRAWGCVPWWRRRTKGAGR
jgi:hypothetical protein